MQSIGGSAAAKVVRAGVHPVKISARGTLVRLRAVLDAPPPWLARIMSVEVKSPTRFAEDEEELEA